eukprot:9958929-Ditylum_brightwellii.AAC.1
MKRTDTNDDVAKANILINEMKSLFTTPKAPKTSRIGFLVRNFLRTFVKEPSTPHGSSSVPITS